MHAMNEETAQPDDDLYAEWRCKRCGVCCGATDGDACVHLRRDGDTYYCNTYETRLGYRKSLSGQTFRCVTIRHLIETTGGYAECAYVQELLRRRAAVEAARRG
jgi:hypothetical protein